MSSLETLYKEIYALLDRYPVAAIDCGSLCGKVCCCFIDPTDTESGMELFPGEEEVFPLEAPWHKPRFLKSSLFDYPPEWGEQSGLFQIRCTGPCPREERPVNCRIAPFQIYTEGGKYYLAVIEGSLSYPCPLTHNLDLINPDFVTSAKKAARLLLTLPRVKALADWDSRGVAPERVCFKVELEPHE